jgi:hypothetical protein
MFHKIESQTDGKKPVPLTKYSVSNQTSRILNSYLFESILLLWGMLFYLVLIVIWSKDKSSMHYMQNVRPGSLSSTAITLTGIFFCAPLSIISLGAATRAIQNSVQELHGPAQNCSRIARIFFHISWILFIAIQFCLHQMKN